MSVHQHGPPIEDGAPKGPTDVEGLRHPTTNKTKVYRRRGVPGVRHTPQDVPSQLRRRRAASWRMVPLDCGHRDPWVCGCYTTEPPLSDHALDGWRDAAQHVLATGRMPVVPIEVRRALWRRPADRQLAELLHDGCGQVAS